MSDRDFTPKQPAFHIVEPNLLLGNKVMITLNPIMARELCDALEQVPGVETNRSLYALLKGIRRYYHKARSLREGRTENPPLEVDAASTT